MNLLKEKDIIFKKCFVAQKMRGEKNTKESCRFCRVKKKKKVKLQVREWHRSRVGGRGDYPSWFDVENSFTPVLSLPSAWASDLGKRSSEQPTLTTLTHLSKSFTWCHPTITKAVIS